jgi:cell division septum initiation protein DivIVA
VTTPHTHGDTPGAPDALECRLTALTDWHDAEPTLHAEALRHARGEDAEGAPARRAGVLARLRRPGLAVPMVAAATLVLFAAAQLWSGSGARSSARRGPAPIETEEAVKSFMDDVPAFLERDQAVVQKITPSDQGAHPFADPADRSVIRKATIEIQSKDVRTDFARAGLLVNEGLGEFIESSSLTGEGAATQGTLTLRVTADRLSDVLNQLRALGTVATEKSSGDDVTEQAVDLSARLRNEQKVEDELLKLLESRKGAPLKEILDLREQVAKVRERIEQMTAQQERLGRSVSLATILVILRPDVAPPADAEQSKHESALDYFGARLTVAWRAGTRSLADSAAGFVQGLLGGLVWWTLLAVAAIAGIRWMREAQRRAAREPAPAM